MTARRLDGRLVCARCQRGFNMLRSWGLCEACSAAEPEPASEWRDRDLVKLRAELATASAYGERMAAAACNLRVQLDAAISRITARDADHEQRLERVHEWSEKYEDALEAAQRRGSALAEDVRAAIEWCDGEGAPDVRAALARYDAAEGSEDA